MRPLLRYAPRRCSQDFAFVARLASIRILSTTQSVCGLISGRLAGKEPFKSNYVVFGLPNEKKRLHFECESLSLLIMSRTISPMRLLLLALLLLPITVVGQENDYSLVIKNHRFSPAELIVPAGKKIRLRVENQDPTAEEFESHSLNREKVIPGNTTATIFVGPLAPGRYPFFGEFNEKTAQGVLIAQ